MTEFKVGDEVWVKGVINQIDKGGAWDLYISTRENGVWIDSRLDECIPQNDTDEKPRYLRNVLARLRELPEHDREVWLKGIMDEFELDFSHAKWREGYEQGKFDGAVEAGKSKVVIPQFVAYWIEEGRKNCRDISDLFEFNFKSEEVKKWFWDYKPFDLVARAWLDGYEVEQEKRYVVTDGNHLYLKEYKDVGIIAISNKISESTRYIKKFENKDEAQKVADVLGWKVQEVQDDTKI